MFPYVTHNGKWLGSEYDKRKRKILDNVLVEAPPRTGKSVHAKGVLGTFTGSMVVIDIKGELYADTANFRQDVSDVFKLNLVGPSAKYNPLTDIGRSELELKAAAELLIIDPHDHDPIFAQRAVPAVRAALVAADLAGKPSIPYLAELIRRGPMEFIETLVTFHNDDINNNLTVFLGKPPDQFLVDGAKIFDEGKGFLPSAWGTLVTRLEPFTTQAVLDMMSGNDFTAKELLVRETTVFFTFPERLLRSSSRVIALILEGLLSGMASHADENGGSGEVPCLVLMDEAAQYRVPSLPGYISTLLGRGIALLIYIQSEAQLRASYKEDADVILDNCRSKLYWSPTLSTAKHLSSAFGYREVKQKSKSHQGNTESRVNESYVKRELMTPDEIMQIGPEEAFLLVLGYPPIRGKRIVWYEEKLLKQRLKP